MYWAAIRSGLYLTAVNSHLAADEAAYIVNDSGATAFVTSAVAGDVAQAIIDRTPGVGTRSAYGGAVTCP